MLEPIAIIGIGCRFPGRANDPQAFWKMLVEGVDAVEDMTSERFELASVFDADRARPGRMYTRWGGFVHGIDQFDAGFFGFSMREALRIDPQHRMLLETAWEALEDAGIPGDRLAGSATGVFVGISTHDYADAQAYPQNRALIDAHTNSGGAGSIAANRISYVYDLRGPSFIVDTACSSSLVSVHLACQSLRSGESTLALAGGIQAILNPELTIGFCKASMISPDGRCKAFSAEANGYVRGEGGGIVVLKRLSQALADGDHIYAVIRGSAVNEDGRTNGMTVPGLPAQQEVLREAYRRAGVRPGDVRYIEAHGPGTPVGDPIEAEALATVVACERPKGEVLRIGSVKTNIGHLEAGSGIAGLVKAALVVKHRHIPPSLHFKTPNPAIPFDAYRLKVTAEAEAWPANAPAFTGINSFGFGGANAHVVLEGPPHEPEIALAEPEPRAGLLVTSARSPQSLRGLALAYRDLCRKPDAPPLADLVAAAALQRSHHEHRLGVTGKDLESLADNLDAFLNDETRADVVSGRASQKHPPRLALVFAGMGPQWWGMGRQLLETESVFRAVIEECDALLRRHCDWSLVDELQKDEATSRVAEADFAQPVNFAFQAALWALWRHWGVEPQAVVGHSAGEIAAVYAAGAMDLDEAVRVAFHRGRLQHRATGHGRMAAVGQGLDALRPLLVPYEGRIAVAAVNSPQSVTLSGDTDAIEELSAVLQKQGTFCRVMSVHVPYHSHHMDAIEGEIHESLAKLALRPGSIPIVSEVSGDWLPGDAFDAAYWWRNIRQPVLFGDAILRLASEGFDTFLEVSPHPVLGASVAECLSHLDKAGACIPSLRRKEDDRAMLMRGLAALYARGVSVDWAKVQGRPSRRVSLPLYAWNKERVWLDLSTAAVLDDAAPAGANGTSILGHRVRSVQPHWEVDLENPALDYINDHKIHGAVVYPGAAYVAMALEAASQISGTSSLGLEDVAFRKALFVPENAVPRVQAVYEPGSRAMEIHAQPPSGDANSWTLHAGCRLTTAPGEPPPALDIAAVRARCSRELDRSQFYAEVAKRGFTFGPRFMGVETLYQGDGEALGRIRLPEAHAVEVNGDRVHPALFDAGLQVLIGAVTSREPSSGDTLPAFLPTRAARVVSHRPVGATFWSHATVEELTPESFRGTVSIHDEDGTLLLQVEGLQAKTLEDVRAAASTGGSETLYRQVWDEAPLASVEASAGGAAWCSPVAVAASVVPRADGLSEELGFAGYYADVEPGLERIARAFFVRALTELNVDRQPGSRVSTSTLPDGTPLPEPRRRQLEAIARALAEAGVLEAQAESYKVLRAPDPDDALALTEKLRFARPGWTSVLDLLSRCGLALSDILAGRRSAPEVLFSGDGLADMAAFYGDAPSCRLFNALTAESAAAAVAGLPSGRTLRVLEVGAGTGGTTRYVLPRLPQGRFQYTFTDVSPLFVNQARAEFGEGGAFRYAVLDVGRDPRAQGLEPGSFDLVIGANVVHGTPRVAETLGHLSTLLAPGGLLLLQEITRRPRWLDVIFGITDGWWAFADPDLRPQHALLDPPTWQRALQAAGFEEPLAFSETGDPTPGQSVLVARAPLAAAAAPSGEAWLILSDRRGVGEALARSLRRDDVPVALAFRGETFRRIGPRAYEVPSGSAAALGELLKAAEAEIGAPAGIVHLWSLEMPDSAPTDAAGLLSAQGVGYVSALHLVHALQAEGSARPRRTVFVTAGAQAIDDGADLTDVVQAPLWGFGRVLLHEHPEFSPRLVDCSAEPGPDEVEALAREIRATERQDEVALRRGRRHVRRLARLDLQAERSEVAPSEPARGRAFRADVGSVGDLATVYLGEFARRRPGPDEIEMEVKAASLNFRDVMFAMGMLPAVAFENMLSSGAIGVDCAGVVTAVGSDITHVKPGDEVVALSPASVASHAMTREVVVKKPRGLSFEDAAALPLAYVTALYALENLGHLKAGEKVLIHAAAGGVGLAAVSVAQRAGAEVFATAGSDAKRDFLRGLGVRHVFDSRSLEFAAQILDLTRGRGVDVVLNSLAGEAIDKSLSVLAPRGRFLEIGKADIYRNGDLSLQHFSRNLSFFAIQIDLLCDIDRLVLRETLQRAMDGVEEGSLRHLPTEVFPLRRLEDGLRHLAKARHTGKIVIAIDDPEVPIRALGGDTTLFRGDATYLVTGGLGGVGTALAQWMVKRGAKHVALVSRQAAAGEASDAVARLRERGAEVLLIPADVSDPADVKRALDAADRPEAPLKGVFHGAMVIDDAPLLELDEARFATVMSPKAGGAWNLHLATRERALDHFVLFSSITSVYGNARQANYGAANAFLDALAGHRRAQGLPGLTVNWGVFSDAGYVAQRKELGEYLERQGQLGFRAEQGFDDMAALLRRGVVQATIAKTDWATWADANPVMGASPRFQALVREKPAAAEDKGARPTGKLLERLLAMDPDARVPEVAEQLRRRMAKILGAAPERVDMKTPLTEMGMDSLMAVELMTALKGDFVIDVPAVKLLQGATLEQLAARILEHLKTLGGAVAPAAAPAVVAAPSPVAPIAETPAPEPVPAETPAPAAPAPILDYAAFDFSRWTPFQRVARRVVSGVVATVADVHVEGLEHVPATGPVLMAANHLSMWDAPVLLRYSERRTVIFAAEELRKYPWLHWTLHKVWDAIYLKRGEGDTEALQQALGVLQAGGVLGLSPEGIRTQGGLQRGLSGVAHLAFRSRAPIVPVVVYGQEDIARRLGRLPRTPVHVKMAAPFFAPEGEPTAQAIQALTERVMVEIARLLPPEYRGVYAEAAEHEGR